MLSEFEENVILSTAITQLLYIVQIICYKHELSKSSNYKYTHNTHITLFNYTIFNAYANWQYIMCIH